jgi:hypothetical protein
MPETIQNYSGEDPEIRKAAGVLEDFIGDMENAEFADDSTLDASDAVAALNVLIETHKMLEDDKAELIAEIRRLWEALSRYGGHTYECKIKDNQGCTCGYSDALGDGSRAITAH